jgi:hypothetical protein
VSRTITATAAAVLVSAALLAGYLALGGGDFEPAGPQPPCGRQAAESVDGGLTGTAERIGLNALNATACDLGIPRERLLLSLAGETELDIDPQRRTDAFRGGLRTAIDAEERAGRLGGTQAFLLRQAVNFLPVDALIERLFRGG